MGHQYPAFREVLNRIRVDRIASLASSVRQSYQTEKNIIRQNPSATDLTAVPLIDCTVLDPPISGSYNIAYAILFDDGVKWILKIPRNGHPRCFDTLSAEAVTSETLTVQFIQHETKVPVPTVYDFSPYLENQVGCPYILMEFVQGKPLHRVWFDEDRSVAALEHVRTRILQGIATAMAELSRPRFGQAGSLSFDDAGKLLGIKAARAVDAVTMLEEPATPKSANNSDKPGRADDIFCEKGPLDTAVSSILFGLDRRLALVKLNMHDRGLDKCLRLYTQWAIEHSEVKAGEEEQFVLGHPDLDTQNIFVLEDGTLSAIIDWDGVTTGPQVVGSLRYPSFLIRDWEPTHYQWDFVADELRQDAVRADNSPEELVEYRRMYAQFMEMALSYIPSCSRQSKQFAMITRASPVLGSLEWAANNPVLIKGVAINIFEEIEAKEGGFAQLQQNRRSDQSPGSYKNKPSSMSSPETSETTPEDCMVGDEDTGYEIPADEVFSNYTDVDNNDDGKSGDIDELSEVRLPECRRTAGASPSDREDGLSFPSAAIYAKLDALPAGSTLVNASQGEHGNAAVPGVQHSMVGTTCSQDSDLSWKARSAKAALFMAARGCKKAAQAFHSEKAINHSTIEDGVKEERPCLYDNGMTLVLKESGLTEVNATQRQSISKLKQTRNDLPWTEGVLTTIEDVLAWMLLELRNAIQNVSKWLREIEQDEECAGLSTATMGLVKQAGQAAAAWTNPNMIEAHPMGWILPEAVICGSETHNHETTGIQTTKLLVGNSGFLEDSETATDQYLENLDAKVRQNENPLTVLEENEATGKVFDLKTPVMKEYQSLVMRESNMPIPDTGDMAVGKKTLDRTSSQTGPPEAGQKTVATLSTQPLDVKVTASNVPGRLMAVSEQAGSNISEKAASALVSTSKDVAKIKAAISVDHNGRPIPLNKPCPCGSKHKFKKCCGKVRQAVELDITDTLGNREEGRVESKSVSGSRSPAESISAFSAAAKSSATSQSGDGENEPVVALERKDSFYCDHNESYEDWRKIVGEAAGTRLGLQADAADTEARLAVIDGDSGAHDQSYSEAEQVQSGSDGLVDNGGFTIKEICAALGQGELEPRAI